MRRLFVGEFALLQCIFFAVDSVLEWMWTERRVYDEMSKRSARDFVNITSRPSLTYSGYWRFFASIISEL